MCVSAFLGHYPSFRMSTLTVGSSPTELSRLTSICPCYSWVPGVDATGYFGFLSPLMALCVQTRSMWTSDFLSLGLFTEAEEEGRRAVLASPPSTYPVGRGSMLGEGTVH